MLKKNLSMFMAILAISVVMMPAMAFARGGVDNDDRGHDREHKSEHKEDQASAVNEFGVRILGENNHNRDTDSNDDGKHHGDDDSLKSWHSGFLPNFFYNGTVTATSSTGFTITTKNGTVLVIDADSAKVIQIPRTVIAFGDVEVGDMVHITGIKTGNNAVNASVVYTLPENLKPAVAKGTVTAVTDSTITVQTKEDASITVNTNADTLITNSDKEVIAQADIETGSKVKLFGLWDSILNVFNAIKISLRA